MSRATDALKALPGVSGIKEMGQWPGDAQSDYSRGKLYVSILPSDPFEQPRLTRGKLPESETEIVIPESTASTLKLSVGDTLGIRPGYSSREYRSVSIVGLTPSRTSGADLPASYLTDKGFAAVYGTSSTGAILVIVFIVRSLPIGTRSGIAALRQIDKSIEESAYDLGADSFTVFTTVTLPLIKDSFFSGLVTTFVRSITAISAIILLVTPQFVLITVRINEHAEKGNYGIACAYATILIIITYTAITLMNLFTGKFGTSRKQK